jgi:hypothetical protein
MVLYNYYILFLEVFRDFGFFAFCIFDKSLNPTKIILCDPFNGSNRLFQGPCIGADRRPAKKFFWGLFMEGILNYTFGRSIQL